MIPHRLISPAINVAFVIGSNSRMPRNRHIRLYILVSQKTVSVITVRTGIYAIHASRYLISIAENRQSNRNHNATAYAKLTTIVSYTISITQMQPLLPERILFPHRTLLKNLQPPCHRLPLPLMKSLPGHNWNR